MVDTHSVRLNFDGITYAKGGSVLRQLVAYVGPDAFREGIRAYFKRFAWGNATLADFLDALSEASGRELQEWSKEWLETEGIASLRPVILGDQGVIERLEIEHVSASGAPDTSFAPHSRRLVQHARWRAHQNLGGGIGHPW